jgi:hypothetical protein
MVGCFLKPQGKEVHPMNPLAEAITAVETAATDLGSADQALEAAKSKFDAALSAKTAAEAADASAVAKYNDALNKLIVAAQAAIRPSVPVS